MRGRMKSNGRFFHRGALIGVALVFGFATAARADIWDDIADWWNPPEAATSAGCHSYAKAAVNYANFARRNNCPLGGGRYTTDEYAHFHWCMSVSPKTSREED